MTIFTNLLIGPESLGKNDACGVFFVNEIKQQIRVHTTAQHAPAKVIQVMDIPRTRSGKLVELAVRDVVHNLPVKNIEALANPEALDEFRNRPELRIG